MTFVDFLIRIIFGLHATILVACSAETPSIKPIEIAYDGDTDSKMLRFFEDLPCNSTVIINSKGGKESEAIAVGEIVAKKSITIEIDRFCASACAQYIFIASKTRRIRHNALVSFHVNSFAAKKIGLTNSSKAELDAERAEKLYYEAGIDPSFMVYAALSVGPFCIENNGSGRQRYAAWVPSHRQLKKWKIAVDGYWFDSKSDAMETINSIYRPGTAISFGNENEPYFHFGAAKCTL